MITDIKNVPNSDLQLFVDRLTNGLYFTKITDDNVMVVEIKQFDTFTGQELPDRVVLAAVPVADILAEAERVQALAAERVLMLNTFIANEHLI